ncbi:MAG: DUF58 domain-containing protein [bacterium]
MGQAGLVLVLCALLGYLWAPAFLIASALSLLLAMLALLDLLSTRSMLRGKLSVERDFPQAVTVETPRSGMHLLHNASRIPVRFRIHEDSLPEFRKSLATGWATAAAGESCEIPLVIRSLERGERELGGIGLRVLAGLQLWITQLRIEPGQSVRVYPQIEELTGGDLFAHRRRLWGIGQHHSRKFGRGTDFDHLREYTPDDEYRGINWKATARRGRPVVNQFQVDQSRDLMLLVDCGRLMHTEIGGRPRLDRYLDAAVQLAYLALSQKDRVGLMAFSSETRRYVPPARRQRQLDAIIEAVFDLQPEFVESDYARVLAMLRSRHSKRGLVVLFTDLVDSVSSQRAVANLSRLARTHLPIIVILDDPQIEEMARKRTEGSDDAYIKASAELLLQQKRRTVQELRSRGCMIVNVAADKLNGAVINQYLQVKARNLI